MWGTDEHGLVWREQALASGITENQIATAVRRGRLRNVGRGVYAPSTLYSDDAGEAGREHYRLRSLAAGLALAREDDERVMSHQSAAALLGMGLLLPDHTAVHLVNGRASGGNMLANRIIHPGLLEEDDVVEHGGVWMTSPARTAVDVALSSTDFARILAVFDSALRMGVPREELEERLAVRRRGVARARHVLTFANGLSDNPGESWGRAQMIVAGLPIPVLQSEYRLRDGRRAVVDYDWDGLVVGEFDGFGKYLRERLRPGQTEADAVIAEKLREDKIRDLDIRVVRWGWKRLRDGTLVRFLLERLPKYGVRLKGA